MRMRSLLSATAGLVMPVAAMGQIHTYHFTLDGLQEVPPNASPATGAAKVILDMNILQVSWDVTFTGLLGTFTAAHFHHAPPGVNGPVFINMPLTAPGHLMGTSPISAAMAAEMIAGNTYINIHSTVFPGGEIRGQVVPAPGVVSLLALGGLAASRRRR